MEDLKLAVLIDADNISPKYVKVILDEAASFGVAAAKRIYGDWSDPDVYKRQGHRYGRYRQGCRRSRRIL